MVYDEGLAGRVRDELTGLVAFEEKRCSGGLAFLVNTHMACGVVGDLMVRVGKAGYQDALASEVADPAVLERWLTWPPSSHCPRPPNRPR